MYCIAVTAKTEQSKLHFILRCKTNITQSIEQRILYETSAEFKRIKTYNM